MHTIRRLTALTITSSGATFTNASGPVEDARDLSIFVTSSINGTYATVYIGHVHPQFESTADFATTFLPLMGAVQTTSGVALTTGGLAIPVGMAWTIGSPGFTQVKLATTGGETSGTIVGYAIKMIH